jgi:Cu(I)/Ag(I) efflux system membrane fusion protein
MSRAIVVIGGVAVIALATTLGYFAGHRSAAGSSVATESMAAQEDAEEEVLYWYDPMVPDQHFDKPGKSPFMDMMLVPRYASESNEAGVGISSALQQNLGVRTATVTLDTIASPVRAPGTLQWAVTGEHRVSARVEGLVERLHARTPYARVARGDPLATLLAPTLASAIAEYRALASSRSPEARQLQAAARSRLQLWGVNPAQVSTRDGPPRIVLHAPADGVLAEVAVREGETVMPGQLLFRLNATDTLWLDARVPQGSAGQLQAGDAAQVLVSGASEPMLGKIEAVLPEVDLVTRTQSVRVLVPNPDGTLAAGAFAEVVLQSTTKEARPWIPSEALIMTGRESRVIVKSAESTFLPVAVTTGRQADERTEILAGLVGGEEIVVSGQFLIDSEASLSGLLSRLEPAATSDSAAEPADKPTPETSGSDEQRRVLYWYDPMVPDKHFDQPGKSPFMDMQLVPKYADEVEAKTPATPPEASP